MLQPLFTLQAQFPTTLKVGSSLRGQQSWGCAGSCPFLLPALGAAVCDKEHPATPAVLLAGLGEQQSHGCAHWNARGILQLSLPPTPAPVPGQGMQRERELDTVSGRAG